MRLISVKATGSSVGGQTVACLLRLFGCEHLLVIATQAALPFWPPFPLNLRSSMSQLGSSRHSSEHIFVSDLRCCSYPCRGRLRRRNVRVNTQGIRLLNGTCPFRSLLSASNQQANFQLHDLHDHDLLIQRAVASVGILPWSKM
jgi:hypothetical protein